jgi:periplasmic copper chaperone A
VILKTLVASALGAALGLPLAVLAQSVEVKDAWVRGTVPAQKGTGAFMEITAKTAVRLVQAESPVAQSVELHNMTMDKGVMRMGPVDSIDVPAGKTVKLASGGYHVMFIGLNRQMKPGERVPLKLTFELADKKRESVDLSVEIRDLAGNPAGKAHHGH